MQQFRIDELLRYALCGGLFLATFLVAHPSSPEILTQTRGIGDATVLLGIVLLIGSLIYTMHRAITFHLILYPLAWGILALFRVYPFEWGMVIPFRLSRVERDLDRWRLSLCRSQDPLYAVIAEWGAQVHFLYCSALAILLALFIATYSYDCVDGL
jgi:hypothetical protein